MSEPPPRTAAALVIGNEILTGKVQEINVAFLAKELFGLGVVLRRVVICSDDIEVIAEDLEALRHRHDHVFTSGGVGPTHDDVTIAAVARTFDRKIVRSPHIEHLLREHFGTQAHDGHLRMANVPEGAELVTGGQLRWPILKVGNVFVLPGLPEIFRRKVTALRQHIGAGRPFISRTVRTSSEESDIALLLERLDRNHPSVAIGSYPRWGDPNWRVAITFDGRDAALVDGAVAELVASLPPEQIVAIES